MLRFGLIGCGKIARRHASLLSNGGISGVELAGVVDTNRDAAQQFASEFKTRAFADIKAMVGSSDIDAIVVLTPSGVHAENVVEAADFGKPIVVEKPMALTLDDADRMIEACDRSGARLFVVKQNRFNRPIVRLREAIDSGRFGKLVLGTVRLRWCRRQSYYDSASWRGTWQSDGGVICNQASHHIDLLEWMFGRVESVYAMGSTALVDIEAEDTAVATVRFRSGALGVIEATTATRPKDLEGSLSVLGERGSVVVGGFAANELLTWEFDEKLPEDENVFQDSGKNPEHPYGYAHSVYYEHVRDCIASGKQQLVDGLAGRRSLELISAIYESIMTKSEVQIQFNPRQCRLGLGDQA